MLRGVNALSHDPSQLATLSTMRAQDIVLYLRNCARRFYDSSIIDLLWVNCLCMVASSDQSRVRRREAGSGCGRAEGFMHARHLDGRSHLNYRSA